MPDVIVAFAVDDASAEEPELVLKHDNGGITPGAPGCCGCDSIPVNGIGGVPDVVIIAGSIKSAEQPDFSTAYGKAIKDASGQFRFLGDGFPGLEVGCSNNAGAEFEVQVVSFHSAEGVD